MRRARAIFLLIALLVPASLHAQKQRRVETVQLKSELLGKVVSYRVVVPVRYLRGAKRTRDFPALYLLHGLAGDYRNWTEKSKITLYATRYDLFVITPEGGDGWYTDSATVSADKYESYVLQELIPDVERRYRVSKARGGRAIAGLSMGGYGALKFGVKHPDRFIFAASMSGALDAAVRTDADPRFAWGFLRPSILQTFGESGSPVRSANDLHRLVRELPAERLATLPFFYLDCGTEDGFLATNRELATIFLERKIPHEFRQLPGGHNWTYWDAQVQEVLKIAQRKMSATKR
jgi:putative tributyrin esterase